VLYGLALILLAEGAVDRILVLCPSNTIEDGLLKKFKELAGKGLEFSAPQNQLFTVLHHITSRETGFPSAGRGTTL
jgi:type III restriction enzyme